VAVGRTTVRQESCVGLACGTVGRQRRTKLSCRRYTFGVRTKNKNKINNKKRECVSHELVEAGATPGCASATGGAEGKGRVGPKKVAMGGPS
jgi:hypothetical protein